MKSASHLITMVPACVLGTKVKAILDSFIHQQTQGHPLFVLELSLFISPWSIGNWHKTIPHLLCFNII